MVEVDYGGGNAAGKTGRSRRSKWWGRAVFEGKKRRASSGRRKETGVEEKERPNEEKSKWASDQVTWRRTRPTAHDSDTLSYSSGSSPLLPLSVHSGNASRSTFSLHSAYPLIRSWTDLRRRGNGDERETNGQISEETVLF